MLKTKEIKGAIIKKFGSLRECADAMSIDLSTLSRNIKKPTLKTLNKLREVGIVFDNPIIKEKEVGYGGLSLIKQIKLLEERNQAINIEFQKVKAQIIQLKKDCGHKEGCLVKNIKLKNEE